VKEKDIDIEIQHATAYAATHINANQSIVIMCPFNYFSQDMVSFYLQLDGKSQTRTLQYPELAVDTYTPNFNITEFISLCRQNNVKYVFTYENGGLTPYFNTTLTLVDIYIQIYNSGNFTGITPQETFGQQPRRVLLLEFIG
jgi:hypothetical protein